MKNLKKILTDLIKHTPEFRIIAPVRMQSVICQAIEDNNAERVKSYLKNYSFTSLFGFACAKCQNAEILQMMIDDGADVNQQDRYGKTPLHIMIKQQRFADGLALLLKNGANADLQDSKGNTPLMCLLNDKLIDERADEFAILLRATDVTIKNKKGLTALFYAENNHQLHNRNLVAELHEQYNQQIMSKASIS